MVLAETPPMVVEVVAAVAAAFDATPPDDAAFPYKMIYLDWKLPEFLKMSYKGWCFSRRSLTKVYRYMGVRLLILY